MQAMQSNKRLKPFTRLKRRAKKVYTTKEKAKIDHAIKEEVQTAHEIKDKGLCLGVKEELRSRIFVFLA